MASPLRIEIERRRSASEISTIGHTFVGAHVRAIHRCVATARVAKGSAVIVSRYYSPYIASPWLSFSMGRDRPIKASPARSLAAPSGDITEGLTRSNGDLTFHPRWLARCMWRPLSFGDSDKKRGKRFSRTARPGRVLRTTRFQIDCAWKDKWWNNITLLHRDVLWCINKCLIIFAVIVIHWKQFLFFSLNAENRLVGTVTPSYLKNAIYNYKKYFSIQIDVMQCQLFRKKSRLYWQRLDTFLWNTSKEEQERTRGNRCSTALAFPLLRILRWCFREFANISRIVDIDCSCVEQTELYRTAICELRLELSRDAFPPRL